MTLGEYQELKRIADSLEKIALIMSANNPIRAQQQTYEPAPYWHNPNWQPPKVGG
jgi:hypothetical protein